MRIFIYGAALLAALYTVNTYANEYVEVSSVKIVKTVKLTTNDTDNYDECMVRAQMYIGDRRQKEVEKCQNL